MPVLATAAGTLLLVPEDLRPEKYI